MSHLKQIHGPSTTQDILHEDYVSTTVYGSAYASRDLPKYELAEDEMDPRMAYRFVADELAMNGKPALNLASFVTTTMEPEAEKLMADNLSLNFIDTEEYPACVEKRCVNMVGSLFNAPKEEDGGALGVSTVGSSEAIILACLAAKKRWQNSRRAAGKDTSNPNVVMSSAVQVCWEKACVYLDVEQRFLNVTEDRYVADPKQLIDLVDENTIVVCAIMGTTYTGEYEDVQAINDLLEARNKKDGLSCYIHVDAASGGFPAAFMNPELQWDFRLPLVGSINTSGHKYGLCYAGIGFAIWRSKEYLPKELLFTLNYLGSDQISFTLNFSKSAVQVIGQFFTFLRLGKQGYRAIFANLLKTSDYLADQILKMGDGKFKLMSATDGKGLPLVAWRLATPQSNYDEYTIAHGLKEYGWIVPAYTMSPGASQLKMLRVVVREDFSRSRCENFLRDLHAVMKHLDSMPTQIGAVRDIAKRWIQSSKTHKNDHPGAPDGKGDHLQEKTGKTAAIC